jgi:hypothetical protein
MRFKNRFIALIEQDEAPVAAASTPETERAAMASTLDNGVSPEQYDVPAPAEHSQELKVAQVNELKSWIAEIDGIVKYLNAPNPNSIQSKLHAAPCDTLFDDIARSEKKKISRLAAELSTLAESLKGYLISSNS